MYNIIKLKEQLPYKYKSYTLNLIDYCDIDMYLENFTKDYMNEFIDLKVNKNSNLDSLKLKLKKLVFSYNSNSKVNGEARLILKDNISNEMVAGVTIYENGDNKVSLGYWVLPTYQNKGIAKELIGQTINIVKKLDNISSIELEIREDNKASHKVADSNNFILYNAIKGLYKINYIYKLEI